VQGSLRPKRTALKDTRVGVLPVRSCTALVVLQTTKNRKQRPAHRRQRKRERSMTRVTGRRSWRHTGDLAGSIVVMDRATFRDESRRRPVDGSSIEVMSLRMGFALDRPCRRSDASNYISVPLVRKPARALVIWFTLKKPLPCIARTVFR